MKEATIVPCEKCMHGKPDTNDKNFVECNFFEKTFAKDFYCKMGEPKSDWKQAMLRTFLGGR